jgi:excinuclease ABC subunit B
VRPARHQVDDLLKEVRIRIAKKERVLVTTLTKRSAEDLTEYYESLGLKVKYLHSDIKTIERTEIIRDLRLGVFDILVGINLLREGLDIPEVSLVAITDADKEGFLRSERSLIQTIGRAARNAEGQVILYADNMTESMQKAINETNRRRGIQEAYNKEHGITPATIKKRIRDSVYDIYDSATLSAPLPGISKADLKLIAAPKAEYLKDPKLIDKEILKLRKQMKKSSDSLEFEEAARLRDDIKRLELVQLSLFDGVVDKEMNDVVQEGS